MDVLHVEVYTNTTGIRIKKCQVCIQHSVFSLAAYNWLRLTKHVCVTVCCRIYNGSYNIIALDMLASRVRGVKSGLNICRVELNFGLLIERV